MRRLARVLGIALELGSLRGDRIVLPHIEIEGVGVHLQRKGDRGGE